MCSHSTHCPAVAREQIQIQRLKMKSKLLPLIGMAMCIYDIQALPSGSPKGA